MPHVVFDRNIDLVAFSENFAPLFVKEPCVIRLQDVFLSRSKRSALVQAVAVDHKNQSFLIEISAKDDKTTVRLFPGTDPDKTDGVLLTLAHLSAMIRKQFASPQISKTNIAQFMDSV